MTTPTTPLRQQMTSFNISNSPQPPQQVTAAPTNPFTSNAGGRGNLFQPTQSRNLSQSNNPRTPATLADRVALLACLQKYPHHPDMDAGRKAHQAQQVDWARTHGLNAVVTESTPYPLHPGMLPVRSGECFTCGFSGHFGCCDGSTCGDNKALHPHEQTWRSICAQILRQTHQAASVQLVTVEQDGMRCREMGKGHRTKHQLDDPRTYRTEEQTF